MKTFVIYFFIFTLALTLAKEDELPAKPLNDELLSSDVENGSFV